MLRQRLMQETRALAFCEDASYINNIDLLWEELVFLSFRLHTTYLWCFQNKPSTSFDSSPPPDFLLFQHRGTPIKLPEEQSVAVPEARAFQHGPQRRGPGWWAPPPLQNPNILLQPLEGASTGESPYSCRRRCAGGCQLRRSRLGRRRWRWDRGHQGSWVPSDEGRGQQGMGS